MKPLIFLAALLLCVSAAPALEIDTDTYSVGFDLGVLTRLSTPFGIHFAPAAPSSSGMTIHRIAGDDRTATVETLQTWDRGSGAQERYAVQTGQEGAHITSSYTLDKDSGDLVLQHHAVAPEKGVWGVEWGIENIPLSMNIIAPVFSGNKFTRTTPGSRFTFDYPMLWEAQFVLVEGEGGGFYMWAEDAKGLFKRLIIERRADGWRLGFISMAFAPFEEKTSCDSVRWHFNTYQGDWRVPARRYRDWSDRAFHPIPTARQQPDWVKDIRCCVILPSQMDMLEALSARLDPKQTLLYIYDWRKAGYDRDYPTYDQPHDFFAPFIERAHALGFRVMLHVNYFGCDPLNPLYEEFEPYQCRSPWGAHEKEWWLWTQADPIIKFAYINPAYKPWRDLLVSRFKALCETYGIDALHLDQTLCIYNDYNGLIDGLSMIEGNIAIHRELREALPNVALSGEGLNEITARHEAFAQRHAWGINHTEDTFNTPQLRMAHPISSYFLRPYTTLYGYLGMASPANGPLYAAWNESYQSWGVIPTLKPDPALLSHPDGFAAQFFDEAACWQKERVDIDLDASWPPDVAFPFRTEDGRPVVRTTDRRLLCADREISRTITGVTEIALRGSIPGWQAYSAEKIIGLNPDTWYPYSPQPRNLDTLHVTDLPQGFTVGALASHEMLALVHTRAAGSGQIQLAQQLGNAVCISRPFQGPEQSTSGELNTSDGALFITAGDALHAHPPYRVPDSGTVCAQFSMPLPSQAKQFRCEVALDSGAVGEGKSDGVLFSVTVRCGAKEYRAERLCVDAQRMPLVLDLTPVAGQSIVLELGVDPGPNHDPTFDWARWYAPRIECDPRQTADLALGGINQWPVLLSGIETYSIPAGQTEFRFKTDFPGGAYLLKSLPESVTVPLDIARHPFVTSYINSGGQSLESAPNACVNVSENSVDGLSRLGLFMHPPNNGCTLADFAMTLPPTPVRFHAYIGLRDGAQSKGVVFVVRANGTVLVEQKVLPGPWQEISADLASWAERPVVLSLGVDSDGGYQCDWACWGEPKILPSSDPSAYAPQDENTLPKMVDITWSRGPDLPQGFQDSNGGVLDNTLISACGFCQGRAEDNAKKPGMYPRGFMKNAWALDLLQPQLGWQTIPEFPGVARQGLLCATLSDALYYWGGFSYSEPFCYSDGFRLSKNQGQWIWEPLPPLPWPLCGSMSVSIGSKIYVLGGADYDANAFYTWKDRNGQQDRLGARFLCLDTQKIETGWQSLPECPGTPRWVACLSIAQGKIYLLGGATGSEYSTVVDNWCFDPQTQSWSRLRDLPIASGNFPNGNMTFQDRYILLAGGYQYSQIANPDGSTRPPYGTPRRFEDKGEYYNDIFVYDVNTGDFGRADSMPLNNNLSMALIRNDEVFMIGGETGTAIVEGVFYGHHPELFLKGKLRAHS